MNYYERFVGDFQRDTGHLSCVEVGVYDRLLDHYYATEKPLPFDLDDLCRIARAMDKSERKAVERVADDFFPADLDGKRHNARADREIAKAQNRINAAKENGKKGGRPAKDKGNGKTADSQNDKPKVTQEKPIGFSSGIPAETHAGVHHAPDPRLTTSTHQSAEVNSTTGTPAGAVCARLKSAGILDVNPLHPKLLALLGAGLSVEEIAAVGPEAKAKGKGFAWILATAEGRRRDAAATPPLPKTRAQAAKKDVPWFLQISVQATEDKAKEASIAWKPGEDFVSFRNRVLAAHGITDDVIRKARAELNGEEVEPWECH